MDNLDDQSYCTELIEALRKEPREAEWLEFKENKFEKDTVGQYLSALANGAALKGKRYGYLVWGIRDADHEAVGTKVRLSNKKIGNEPLVNWINNKIRPPVQISFGSVTYNGQHIEILRIERAISNPIKFNGAAYVRVGQALKPISSQEGIERELWRALQSTSFEQLIAAERLTEAEVLEALDATTFAEMLGEPVPASRSRLIDVLAAESLIVKGETGGWSITNLGLMVAANRMTNFPSMARKPLRVITYAGNKRIETENEKTGELGYAIGFKNVVAHLLRETRGNEVIGDAIRTQPSKYPAIALRELVANLIIHQDFAVRGSGPVIEIFQDRVEFTNPGVPLINVERFLDSPPESRNEKFASLMRRLGICEERGSGVDKVIDAVEIEQLPAPKFETRPNATKATLFVRKDLTSMDSEERVRAVYLHTCLRFVNHEPVNNGSIRTRFGLNSSENSAASRLLKEALIDESIKIADPTAGTKNRRYVPFWA